MARRKKGSPVVSNIEGLTARQRLSQAHVRDEYLHDHQVARAARAFSNSMKETEAEARHRTLDQTRRVLAAAYDEGLYERGAALREWQPGDPGRPPMFPNAVMLLFGQAISVFTSARKASNWFGYYKNWKEVVTVVRAVAGDEYADRLPTHVGPLLYQWNHFQRKFKTNGWLPVLADVQRQTACDLALRMSMYDPNARRSLKDIKRAFTTTFDGKVCTSPSRHPYVNTETGELGDRRADDNTKSWPEAGDDFEWGVKSAIAWGRLEYFGTRLMLDVETLTPDDGDEAAAIVKMTNRLHDRLPGMQTIVTDGVLRSTHIDPLMKRGLVVVNKPAQGARNSPSTIKVGDRRAKSHHIETAEFDEQGTQCRHRLFGIDGAPYVERIDAAGKKQYDLLPGRTIGRARAATSKTDAYTDWYRDVRIACSRHQTTHAHRIKLGGQPGDDFKRSEYLRQIAMTDTDFKRVYGYRPDAESGNKDIEEAWHLKRMPAWGWHNQSLRMLLHAGQVNAEAWRIHLERLWDHGNLTTPLPTEAA